jgi:hyperosmotically inducible protein
MTSLRTLARALTLVVGLALVSAAPAAAAGRTIGQIIDDATIVAEVKTKLTAEKLSNLTKIDVKSESGVVTLAGTVDSTDRAARAVQIASSVNGVKAVLNNMDIAGGGATAGTATSSTATSSTATTSTATTSNVEVTGTVASVDAATGTITLKDGRVLRATDQTVVWQPSSVGALKPGSQVLVRGASPTSYQAGGSSTGARHWRMATVSRVDRSAGELILNDGSAVKVTPSTNVHRGTERLGLDRIEPGWEVVVYTPSTSATEATEVAVVWTPTASAK